MFACTISDILERFCGCETLVLADVTYGACCMDDYSASALDCDMIVHYGHSCLIPVDETTIRTLYIFVDIKFDVDHIAMSVAHNLNPENCDQFNRTLKMIGDLNISQKPNSVHDHDVPDNCNNCNRQIPSEPSPLPLPLQVPSPGKGAMTLSQVGQVHIVLGATIQFVASLPSLRDKLIQLGFRVTVLQSKPLSPGEVLGCTSPRISDPSVTHILFIGDGRFHLESIMIANPEIPAIKYDPYSQVLSLEEFDHKQMHSLRAQAIRCARGARKWGLILGTLGRQGSLSVLKVLESKVRARKIELTTILLSEISPEKLKKFSDIDAFVQVACPRLSIDWGYSFSKPLLSPYEAVVALNDIATPGWFIDEQTDKQDNTQYANESGWQSDKIAAYPMDYYAYDSLGPWTPNHGKGRVKVHAHHNDSRTSATVG